MSRMLLSVRRSPAESPGPSRTPMIDADMHIMIRAPELKYSDFRPPQAHVLAKLVYRRPVVHVPRKDLCTLYSSEEEFVKYKPRPDLIPSQSSMSSMSSMAIAHSTEGRRLIIKTGDDFSKRMDRTGGARRIGFGELEVFEFERENGEDTDTLFSIGMAPSHHGHSKESLVNRNTELFDATACGPAGERVVRRTKAQLRIRENHRGRLLHNKRIMPMYEVLKADQDVRRSKKGIGCRCIGPCDDFCPCRQAQIPCDDVLCHCGSIDSCEDCHQGSSSDHHHRRECGYQRMPIPPNRRRRIDSYRKRMLHHLASQPDHVAARHAPKYETVEVHPYCAEDVVEKRKKKMEEDRLLLEEDPAYSLADLDTMNQLEKYYAHGNTMAYDAPSDSSEDPCESCIGIFTAVSNSHTSLVGFEPSVVHMPVFQNEDEYDVSLYGQLEATPNVTESALNDTVGKKRTSCVLENEEEQVPIRRSRSQHSRMPATPSTNTSHVESLSDLQSVPFANFYDQLENDFKLLEERNQRRRLIEERKEHESYWRNFWIDEERRIMRYGYEVGEEDIETRKMKHAAFVRNNGQLAATEQQSQSDSFSHLIDNPHITRRPKEYAKHNETYIEGCRGNDTMVHIGVAQDGDMTVNDALFDKPDLIPADNDAPYHPEDDYIELDEDIIVVGRDVQEEFEVEAVGVDVDMDTGYELDAEQAQVDMDAEEMDTSSLNTALSVSVSNMAPILAPFITPIVLPPPLVVAPPPLILPVPPIAALLVQVPPLPPQQQSGALRRQPRRQRGIAPNRPSPYGIIRPAAPPPTQNNRHYVDVPTLLGDIVGSIDHIGRFDYGNSGLDWLLKLKRLRTSCQTMIKKKDAKNLATIAKRFMVIASEIGF